jgi:outer membrane lipoprotein
LRPETYHVKFFIFGGIIANTTVTNEGSLIEALFVPVDSFGNLKDVGRQTARFLALYPKDKGILDPVLYHKGRQITAAAVFKGLKAGKIDQMDYVFPEFVVIEIHLWEELPEMQYISRYHVPYGRWGPYWDPFLWPPLPHRPYHHRRYSAIPPTTSRPQNRQTISKDSKP